MQLNPSEISELIKSRISGLGADAEVRNTGTVISVTDGICRVRGLSGVMQGEMLEFPGNTFGLALNLERDSVGAVVLGDYLHISEGDEVKTTGRILEVPVGEALLGRVIDAAGQPLASTLIDYLLPGPTEIPHMRIGHTQNLSPYSAHGIKGVGEGGIKHLSTLNLLI